MSVPPFPVSTLEIIAWNDYWRDQVRAMVEDYAKRFEPKLDGKAIDARPLRREEIIRAHEAVQSYAAECAKLLSAYLMPEPIVCRADQLSPDQSHDPSRD